MRDSVVFYRSFWEAIKKLPDKDQLESLTAIIEYGLNDAEPQSDGVSAAIFLMARPQIDANNKRYRNGTKGGRPITKQEPNNNQNKIKPEPNEKEKENVNVKEKDDKTFFPEMETTPDSRIAGSFILNDGSMYNVTENDVERLQQLYPGIDCMQELRNIIGWCDSNPKNRKTRAGAKRFINSWMARAQNSAPVQRHGGSKSQSGTRFGNFDQRDNDYDRMVFDDIKRRAEAQEDKK